MFSRPQDLYIFIYFSFLFFYSGSANPLLLMFFCRQGRCSLFVCYFSGVVVWGDWEHGVVGCVEPKQHFGLLGGGGGFLTVCCLPHFFMP